MTTIRFLAAAVTLVTIAACSEPLVPNLNNPTEEELNTITDRSQIQALATGLLDSDRQTQFNYVFFPEMIARDILRLDGSDPPTFKVYSGRLTEGRPVGSSGRGGGPGRMGPFRVQNRSSTRTNNPGTSRPHQ